MIHNLIHFPRPAISSGIFGMPKELAAKIILAATLRYCNKHKMTPDTFPMNALQDIRFTNLDETTVAIFAKEIDKVLPGQSSA